MYLNITTSTAITAVMETLTATRTAIPATNGVFGSCVDLNTPGEYNRFKKNAIVYDRRSPYLIVQIKSVDPLF